MDIKIKQVKNGYIYEIHGLHKLGGEFVCESTQEFEMLEKIAEAVMGYKCEVKRK